MKKITTILFALLLGFAMAGCTAQDDAGTPEDVINPTNLTFSLTDGTDNPDVENFTTIDADPFIAEEGSTVLEATELYCVSHDMTITIEKKGSYVTEINGFAQGDYTDTTGWVFTVNGEMPDVGAGELPSRKGMKLSGVLLTFRHIHGRLCIKNLFRKFLLSSPCLHI